MSLVPRSVHQVIGAGDAALVRDPLSQLGAHAVCRLDVLRVAASRYARVGGDLAEGFRRGRLRFYRHPPEVPAEAVLEAAITVPSSAKTASNAKP
jgi:hypothetical protein